MHLPLCAKECSLSAEASALAPGKEGRDTALSARRARVPPCSPCLFPPSSYTRLADLVAMARNVSLGGSLLRLSHSRVAPSLTAPAVRQLATPSSSKTAFSKKLEGGPSLDDFIAGDVTEDAPSRVVLGNTSQCVSCSHTAEHQLTLIQTPFAVVPEDVDTDRILFYKDKEGSQRSWSPHCLRRGTVSEYWRLLGC